MSDPHDLEALLREDGALARLARRLAGDAHAAADLLQDTAARGLSNPPAAGSRWYALLATAMRRLAIDRFRAGASRRRREVVVDRPTEAPSAADVAARAELHRKLLDALQGLSEPYYTTVWLRFVDDLPPRTIARRLGISAEAVRTRVRRGLEQLRHALDGDGHDWRGLALAASHSCVRAALFANAATFIMTKKALIAGAALAPFLLAVWIVRDDLPTNANIDAARPTAPTSTLPAVATGERTALASEPEPAPVIATVRYHDGRRVADARYWLWRDEIPARLHPGGARELNPPILHDDADGVTDRDGSLRLYESALAGITVAVAPTLWVTLTAEPGRIDYLLPPLATIRVDVVASVASRWRIRLSPCEPLDASRFDLRDAMLWTVGDATVAVEASEPNGSPVTASSSSRPTVLGSGTRSMASASTCATRHRRC